MAEAGDKGLGVLLGERGMGDDARAHRSPAGGLDEVGLDQSFIYEDQHFQCFGKVRLAGFNSNPAPLCHVGPQGFAGEQRFLYG